MNFAYWLSIFAGMYENIPDAASLRLSLECEPPNVVGLSTTRPSSTKS